MRFVALVALAVVASTVPSLAAPAPYPPRRVTSKHDTASSDDNTFVDTSVPEGFVRPRSGTVILPGVIQSLNAKRDATIENFPAIAFVPAKKRDIISVQTPLPP